MPLQRLGEGQAVEVVQVTGIVLESGPQDDFGVGQIDLLGVALVELADLGEEAVQFPAAQLAPEVAQQGDTVGGQGAGLLSPSL